MIATPATALAVTISYIRMSPTSLTTRSNTVLQYLKPTSNFFVFAQHVLFNFGRLTYKSYTRYIKVKWSARQAEHRLYGSQVGTYVFEVSRNRASFVSEVSYYYQSILWL